MGPCSCDGRAESGRVDLGGGRHEQHVDAGALGQFGIGLLVPRIGGQVGGSLNWVGLTKIDITTTSFSALARRASSR